VGQIIDLLTHFEVVTIFSVTQNELSTYQVLQYILSWVNIRPILPVMQLATGVICLYCRLVDDPIVALFLGKYQACLVSDAIGYWRLVIGLIVAGGCLVPGGLACILAAS